VVELHQPLDKGQPQAQSSPAAVKGSVRLRERIEEPRDHVRADARAGVADTDEREAGGLLPLDRDGRRPALARELGRVLQEVADDLREAGSVGLDAQATVGELEAELDSRTSEQGSVIIGRPPRQVIQVQALALEVDHPARNPGHVEQIVDESHQVSSLPLDHPACPQGPARLPGPHGRF
jgi:hypothetical protein